MKITTTIFTVLMLTLFAMPSYVFATDSSKDCNLLFYEWNQTEKQCEFKCSIDTIYKQMQISQLPWRKEDLNEANIVKDWCKKAQKTTINSEQLTTNGFVTTFKDFFDKLCQTTEGPTKISDDTGRRCINKVDTGQTQPTETIQTKKNKKAQGASCTATVGGHGEYDANGKCVITKCDDTKNYVVNEEQTHCISQTTQKIKDNIDTKKTNKNTCDEAKNSGAKWIAGKCICPDNKHWDESSIQCVDYANGDECTPSDKNADSGTWNQDKKQCVVSTCKNTHKLTDNGECITKEKAEQKEKKLDKEYTSDIEKLIGAYNNKVQELTQQCEEENKKIQSGECK